VAGTSVGAWVAAHYALFQDLSELKNKTVGHAKDKMLAMIEPTFSGGLIGGQKLQKLLVQWFDGKSFADVKIPLTVVTTDILSGQQVLFTQGDLALAVRASMAVATMFRAVKFGNLQLVDGGLVNPVPDDVVRKMGADIVIAVNLDNFELASSKKNEYTNLASTSTRSLQIMRHNLAKYSIKSADVVIEPLAEEVGLVGFKSLFNDKQKQIMVDEGYKKTMAAMAKIKELLAD